MLQAFFNGLGGLSTFSKGLDRVSSNVSNMNTPGFRGSDTFFRSISGNEQGLGSEVSTTRLRTHNGEMRQTGNNTDLAIEGAGFFVLKDNNGDFFYTRAGQFQVDKDGLLIDSATKFHVAGINAAGNLIDLDMSGQKILPAKPTTKIDMIGNLVVSSTTHTISDINVFDKTGASQKIKFVLDKQTDSGANSIWKVDIKTEADAMLGSGNIAFSPDGSPVAGSNTIDFTLTNNGQSQSIQINFGTPGSFNFATQFSGASSTLGAKVLDGSAIAGLTTFAFNEKGIIQYTYSNGEKRDGEQIALASFTDETQLVGLEKSLYKAPQSIPVEYGRPDTNQFGKIKGANIELSNVDLSQEFGDILIIQRGYQANSRIMTVANEMLEQLYNNTRGG